MFLYSVGDRIVHKAKLSKNHDDTDSEGSRTRRTLPQLPPGEKTDIPTPGIYVHFNPHLTFEVDDSSPRPQDSFHRLSVQDDVEPDSLSDASKSDNGSVVEQRRRPKSECLEKSKDEEKPRLPAKATSFYIDSEEAMSKPDCGGSKPSTPKMERKQPSKTFSTATLTKQRSNQDSGKLKPNISAPNLSQGRASPQPKETPVIPLVRQESFTKERPSNARLPNISSHSAVKDPDPDSLQCVCSQDTHSYLKETESVLAVLEAKIQAGQLDTAPSPVADSLSGGSDVDTSSTVSQRSKTGPNILPKKPSVSGLHRERSSASTASQDSSRQASASERLSENRRSVGTDSSSKADSGRRLVGLRRSVGKRGSTDLSDDPQSSSLPYWPDTVSSDQESRTRHTRKKYPIPLQREDSKTSKVSQTLSRSNSLSAPRPTRASTLRRARLGDASDNEGMETDRLSQEAANATAKQLQETKKPSRLDMLAMPRKRTSSVNPPSDTEASTTPVGTGRTTGFSNRSTESSSSSVRKASVPGPKSALQKELPSRTPITRGRSSSAKYTSSTASE